MNKSFFRQLSAQRLLELQSPTMPKKYRERLKHVSEGRGEQVNWDRLLEELRHNSNLGAEIDRIIQEEQHLKDEEERRERERKEREEKQRKAKEEEAAMWEDRLFGNMRDEDESMCPRNVCKYSVDCDDFVLRQGECR